MLAYVSEDIICSEKRIASLSENFKFRGTDYVQG